MRDSRGEKAVARVGGEFRISVLSMVIYIDVKSAGKSTFVFI